MIVDTAELTGKTLAWAAAQALGDEVTVSHGAVWVEDSEDEVMCELYDPVNDANVLVRILQAKHILLVPNELPSTSWSASTAYGMAGRKGYFYAVGATASEAALKAFVGSEYGDTVVVPKELC